MDQKQQRPLILLAVPALSHFQKASILDVKQKLKEIQPKGEIVVLLGPGWAKKDFIQAVQLHESVRVITNAEEWYCWTKRGDPVLHIELRKQASSLIVMPASLNIVAEFANGLASSLIVGKKLSQTSVLRAWDFKSEQSIELVLDWEKEFEAHPVTAAQMSAISNYSKNIVISRLIKD